MLTSFMERGCVCYKASWKRQISNKRIVFLCAFRPLFKMSAASRKKGERKGKLSFMKHLVCCGLSQEAMNPFNRIHFVAGAEATWQSEKGVQREVGQANKQSKSIRYYVTVQGFLVEGVPKLSLER